MGKGLLAQWRRGIATRGLLGAGLFAVPVAVAAAIGFGTSLSGVAGGLSAFAEGPEITTTADTSSRTLNRAVAALASRPETASAPAGGGSGTSTGGGGAGSVPGDGTTTTGGGTTTGSGGSGGSTAGSAPVISAPDVEVPGTGGGTGGDTVDSTVNNTVNGVNGVLQDLGNTVNGILGGG
jgi:hypothetical protein